MLIDCKDEVYMIDRDNCVFKVQNLQFLHNKDGRHLSNTFLDGVSSIYELCHMSNRSRIEARKSLSFAK